LLAARFSKVADLIGLSPDQQEIITRNNPKVEDRIKKVMERWIQDAHKLCTYKCTWKGMCKLLDDLELSSKSQELREAIDVEGSSLKKSVSKGNSFCYNV